MISKASIARHPLHPMLVPIPIGLWIFSLVCDIIFHWRGGDIWDTMALYSMVAGIVGALLAAVPGLLDLYNMAPSQAKRIGLWHMGINLSLVTMYVLNFLWRRNVEPADIGPVILSVVAVLVLLVSGWLGGEMVYVHGIAVEPVEAPKQDKPLIEEHEKTFFGLRLHHRH